MPIELVFARQERPAGLSTLEQVRALAEGVADVAETAAADAVAAAGPAIEAATQQAADNAVAAAEAQIAADLQAAQDAATAAASAAATAATDAAAAVAPAAADAIRAQVAADADRAAAAAAEVPGLREEVRDGRVWNLTANTLHPSGATPPPATATIIVRNNNGTGFTMWRWFAAAGGTVESEVEKQTADGRWWRLIFDSQQAGTDISSLATETRGIGLTAGVIRLSTITGTGDAIVAEPPTQLDNVTISNNSLLFFTPATSNTAADPTMTTRGVTRTIKDADGAAIRAGDIKAGVTYQLRVRSTTELRIIGGGTPLREINRLIAALPPAGTASTPVVQGDLKSGSILTADYGQTVTGTVIDWQVHDTGIGAQGWAAFASGDTVLLGDAQIGKFIRFRMRLGGSGAWIIAAARGPVTEADPVISPDAVTKLSGYGWARRHAPEVPDLVNRMALLRGGAGAAAPISLYPDESFSLPSGWVNAFTAPLPETPCSLLTTYAPAENVIHPCMVEMFNDFCGYRYVCAITAFPTGPALEDPFVYGSQDRMNWEFLGNAPQPLAVKAPVTGSYNSDTFLTHDPRTGEIIVGYRLYKPRSGSDTSATNSDVILSCRTSRDGITWSAQREVMAIPADQNIVLAPTIIFDPATADWHMWTINRPNMQHWSAPTLYGPWTLDPVLTPLGMFNTPHHHEVKWVGDKLTCLMYSRGDGNLYFGEFAAGSYTEVTWGNVGILNPRPTSLYKASYVPVYDPDANTLAFDLWWTAGAAGPAGGVDMGHGRKLQYSRTNAVPLA